VFCETEKVSQIFPTVSQNTAETRFATTIKYTETLLYHHAVIQIK